MSNHEEQEHFPATAKMEQERANLHALGELIKTAKDAFMDLQKQGNDYDVQMAELRIEIINNLQNRIFWFAMTLIFLGGGALFYGEREVGGQIIFAVLGFLGGTTFGIGLARK